MENEFEASGSCFCSALKSPLCDDIKTTVHVFCEMVLEQVKMGNSRSACCCPVYTFKGVEDFSFFLFALFNDIRVSLSTMACSYCF